MPSSFVQRRHRLCLRKPVKDECVADDSDALALSSSLGLPYVLWVEFIAFDDELELGGSLFGTVAVPIGVYSGSIEGRCGCRCCRSISRCTRCQIAVDGLVS